MTNNNKYEIALIENENDGRLCAKLIAEEFTTRNPLIIFNKISSEEYFDRRVRPLMNDVLAQKLSFLIRHRPTNEISATIIASGLFVYCEKYPYDEFTPAFYYPLTDLFMEMINQFVQHD
ncbi:unnamed protein product [Rotaria magnacalcarata]|uniref:Uncharacterized protein n=1 Tax=Rotaria magnacalcarata TaxID=392030 RepID=A0A816BJ94_9BILA|nr:unnamed protein product [Rotaria magnacalcarata]CAF1611533.1 unnamed protein product [Rotaria magnacalcarata]CAF2104486.1 unnamed protein product [Rotaria magnacalcarata]CAF4062069.1 unnamed protein product [Rotaria magnacalcarata]CAF4095022.1 unnamed protein product [Rotaria magnacalcarata]